MQDFDGEQQEIEDFDATSEQDGTIAMSDTGSEQDEQENELVREFFFLQRVVDSSSAILPTPAIQHQSVQHLPVETGTLPTKVRRSNEASQRQKAILDEFFEDYQAVNGVFNYPLMDIDYEEDDFQEEYLDENFLLDTEYVDEDDGYVSGNDRMEYQQQDDGPGTHDQQEDGPVTYQQQDDGPGKLAVIRVMYVLVASTQLMV